MAVELQSQALGSGSFSGFGSLKEEELYDMLTFNIVRLLSARTAKHIGTALEGNYNPYSKEQASEDSRLKQTIAQHYEKMKKMERKKYKKPLMSEAVFDMLKLVGDLKTKSDNDELSRRDGEIDASSDGDDIEKQSLFSKFTSSKRPVGFFGNQLGEAN